MEVTNRGAGRDRGDADQVNFGTIRHRTKRHKECLTRSGMLRTMIKLGRCAEKNWRRMKVFRKLGKVIEAEIPDRIVA